MSAHTATLLIYNSISWVTHFNCRVNMTYIYFLFIFERLTDYDYDFIACFSSWIDYCLFFLSSLFILGCCWLIDLDMVGSFFLHPCLFLVWNFFPVLLWLRLFPNPLCSDVVCIVLLVNMNCFTLILSWNLFISFINFKK